MNSLVHPAFFVPHNFSRALHAYDWNPYTSDCRIEKESNDISTLAINTMVGKNAKPECLLVTRVWAQLLRLQLLKCSICCDIRFIAILRINQLRFQPPPPNFLSFRSTITNRFIWRRLKWYVLFLYLFEKTRNKWTWFDLNLCVTTLRETRVSIDITCVTLLLACLLMCYLPR